MKPIPTNLKIPEEIEMRALLRDAQDQTRIALEVEEVVYDPKDNKLFLYTTSETCYAVSKVVKPQPLPRYAHRNTLRSSA